MTRIDDDGIWRWRKG